ncbi:recombinase family protein [Actinoplanes sp. NBRC 103695]|uniref:recombinase family protein n=1 Tax=Actinoplanes sp. NBRC 103695 TaxID=3032202 RepID=UPI002552CFE0|nr:recombinase family protein [Actinoplanes sp. NBRC 103695]
MAFLGRTSTDEQQDPTLSIPRQLTNSERALLPGMVIVARFYDVESSRKELDQRGRSTAWKKFDIGIPRDGGLGDLLAEATSPDRRFDVVICESIDRIARWTHQGTKIEHDLELAGVPLLAADEPIILNGQSNGRKRKRASQVLLRRTKQGVAEWYILEMLEKSWDGFEVHTGQGWNIGKPPYGYEAEKHRHPVPAKRAQGKHKTKLSIDPVRGPVVVQIYTWRVDEKLAYRAIAERLNTDLDRYPPPQPVDPERAVGRWTGSAVREILFNPKYTGHMVWNRRSTKDKLHPGKTNSREEWIVSDTPTHPAIISVELFSSAQEIAKYRRRSRSETSGTNRHRQTRVSYPLRSHVLCELCGGRRMHGKCNHAKTPYYYCQPRERDRPEGHPATIWLREDELLDGLATFFNRHLLGPDRLSLVNSSIDAKTVRLAENHNQRILAVRRAVGDVQQRLERLTTVLEERDDPDGTVFSRIQARLADLEGQLRERTAELTYLEESAPPDPVGQVDLLAHLPEIEINFFSLPDDRLRRLLDAFAVQISYDKLAHRATYRARVSGHLIPQASQMIMTSARESHPKRQPAGGPVVDGATGRSLHSSVTCPAGGTTAHQNFRATDQR